MERYEVLYGNLDLEREGLTPLTLTLPVRAAEPSGFCVAVVDREVGEPGAEPLAISVQVGDGQPLYEGVPAVIPANGRIHFIQEFVPVNGITLGGAEMRITPICHSGEGLQVFQLAVILQYHEQQ